jgi:cytochrome c oxidase subunit 2
VPQPLRVYALIDTRDEFQDLWGVYLPIGVAVAAIIFGLVFFTLIRYRRRGDDPSSGLLEQRGADLAHAVSGEGPPIIEGLYALVLAGVVAFLLTMTFRTDDRVIEVSADPGVEIDVTAFQWGWRFTYARDGVTVVGDERRPPILVVPLDTTVRFTLSSRDVIHSFWIPEARFKRDAFPDRKTTFDLSFEEADGIGRCAEFCGLAHGEMTFDVVGMDRADFDDWLRTQRRAGEIQRGAVR